MEESTADLLITAARNLRRRLATAFEEYDVTPSQSRALAAISERPEARLSELADALRIAPRSATEVVDALESRALVRRTPDPSDRRAVCVALTNDGRRVLRLLERTRGEESEKFLKGLAPDDRDDLDRLLKQLAA